MTFLPCQIFDTQYKQFSIKCELDALGEISLESIGTGKKFILALMTGLKKKLINIFKSLVISPDREWKMIDGSVVKAHQHASGARKIDATGIGRSVGGLTSKIHMVVDSHGNPIDFKITGGQVHDIQMATELIEKNTQE